MISDDFVHEIQQPDSSLNRLITKIRKRHDEEGIYLIPIIIRENYGWHNISLLANLQPLPRNETSISSRGKNQDSIRATVAQAIDQLIVELVECRKKLKKYENSAFIIFQRFPKSNERNKQLKDVQEQLAINEKDKTRIKERVKKELDKRSNIYKSHFKEALYRAYPITENFVDYFKTLKETLGFIDEYADSLKLQVTREFQQQVEHQKEQERQQHIFQENQHNSMEGFGLIVGGVIALVVFGSLVGSPQIQTQSNNQTQPNNLPPNQIQPSQPDGWIWLGAMYGDSNKISAPQPLEIDAYINPPNIPYRGAEVIAVRDIVLRSGAGMNNQQVGLVRADEKLQIVRIYPLINRNHNPLITEIWAEVHRP